MKVNKKVLFILVDVGEAVNFWYKTENFDFDLKTKNDSDIEIKIKFKSIKNRDTFNVWTGGFLTN